MLLLGENINTYWCLITIESYIMIYRGHFLTVSISKSIEHCGLRSEVLQSLMKYLALTDSQVHFKVIIKY